MPKGRHKKPLPIADKLYKPQTELPQARPH